MLGLREREKGRERMRRKKREGEWEGGRKLERQLKLLKKNLFQCKNAWYGRKYFGAERNSDLASLAAQEA